MPKRVFVSYSHESDLHSQWVLDLAGSLRKRGLESIIDRYVIPDVPLPQWMQNQIESAEYTLFVCTPRYKLRFEGKDKSSQGVTWEAMIANHVLYSNRTRNHRFIAVIPDSGSEDDIPLPFRQFKFYTIPAQFDLLVGHLNGEPEVLPPPVEIPVAVSDASSLAREAAETVPVVIETDGVPNIDAMVVAEVNAPVLGFVCDYAVVSTRAGPEVPVWDNQVFFDRPLLRGLKRVEPQQSFMAVIEASSREPVCVTARTRLYIHSTVGHGSQVNANDPIGKIYIPKANLIHPPFSTTRGQTYSSSLKYTPILAASLWKLGADQANRPPYILECESIGQSGLSAVLAKTAGLFSPADTLQIGMKVRRGARLGTIRDGVDTDDVAAPKAGTIAHVHVKEGSPVHVGRTLVTVRTSATELSLLLSPLVSAQPAWFDLASPISGVMHPTLRPGTAVSPRSVICQVRGNNVVVSLRIDIAEGQLMAYHKQGGERVQFGDRLASVLGVGLIIRAPLLGTFYRAASPGAQPFATVGARLRAGEPAYIVEALKIMNEIEMPFDAVIAEILVEDGQGIGWNQPIMKLIV